MCIFLGHKVNHQYLHRMLYSHVPLLKASFQWKYTFRGVCIKQGMVLIPYSSTSVIILWPARADILLVGVFIFDSLSLSPLHYVYFLEKWLIPQNCDRVMVWNSYCVVVPPLLYSNNNEKWKRSKVFTLSPNEQLTSLEHLPRLPTVDLYLLFEVTRKPCLTWKTKFKELKTQLFQCCSSDCGCKKYSYCWTSKS